MILTRSDKHAQIECRFNSLYDMRRHRMKKKQLLLSLFISQILTAGPVCVCAYLSFAQFDQYIL